MRRPAGCGAKGEQNEGEVPGSGREALAPGHRRRIAPIPHAARQSVGQT